MMSQQKPQTDETLFIIKGNNAKDFNCEMSMIFILNNENIPTLSTAPTIAYKAFAWEPLFQSEFDTAKYSRRVNQEKLKDIWLQRKTYYKRLNDHKLLEPKFQNKSCKICRKEIDDHLEHLETDEHKKKLEGNADFRKL